MSINSNIETDAKSREEGRDAQTVETASQTATATGEDSSATLTGDSSASTAENSLKTEEAGEFEEFTLDDIEVIESKVFA